MKRKYKLMFILMVAIAATVVATAQETRSFSKSWPVNDVETLQVINKFGEVRISDKGSNQVTVDVLVKVDGTGSRAKEVLDDISVDFKITGNKAVVETIFKQNFKSKGKFSIDYTIVIPSRKNLVISNKFGNVVIQNLTGNGNFDIAYGNLTAGQLHGSGSEGLILNLEYGKADVESVLDGRISAGYSKLFLKSAANLTLTSKYSTVSVDNVTTLKLDSKYDTFNFGKMERLIGESKFSNYKIASLSRQLRIESGYGSIKVDHIPAGFEELDVTSSYAQVSLGIEADAAYEVDASCEYCSVEYPQAAFKGNRMKENTRQTIQGKIADGGKSRVRVTSRYGNIKLVK